MLLNFFSDAGHGWLEVDQKLIEKYKIRVSRFSYINDQTKRVYLEEDADAPRMLDALKRDGIQVEFIEHRVEAHSNIRNYRPWPR